jgi:hypothetical protein
MPRFRVAILLGLLLAGFSRAQTPGEAFDAPRPAPLLPGQVEEAPIADMDTASPFLSSPANGDDWRFWASADYALAWVRGKPLPPLATTSPPGTPLVAAGLNPFISATSFGTALIGNTEVAPEVRSMGRLDFGFWFDRDRTLGVGAGFFVAGGKGTTFTAASDGTTIIARPFIDSSNNSKPSSVLVSFPGISSGSVNVFAAMQTFWGANIDIRESFISESWFRMESLIGYRYLHYGESLQMQQNLMATGAAFAAGTKILSNDSFQTLNDFHGCEFGFHTELFWERWSVDILTKLAAGNLRREVLINGSTLTIVPPTTTPGVGGLYALPSNIGNHFADNWVVAPEFGLTVSYELTSNVHLHLGYSILYLQGIARAADQIDFIVNPNLFPPAIGTATRPAFSLGTSDIWIQSVNFGVEFRF